MYTIFITENDRLPLQLNEIIEYPHSYSFIICISTIHQ